MGINITTLLPGTHKVYHSWLMQIISHTFQGLSSSFILKLHIKMQKY